MNEYFIAWWNLENLFNVEGWPDRPHRLKDILKHELKDGMKKSSAVR